MFKISCLDYLKSTIKKRTREFLRDHLKFSRVRFLFIHIKDSQSSRPTVTGNSSSGTGDINILNIRLPFMNLFFHQFNNIRINAGMGNKYPVLSDIIFTLQHIIGIGRKTFRRPAAIFLRG